MSSIEEKLDLYIKAKMTKKNILLKIEAEFGPEAKAKVEPIVDKVYGERKSNSLNMILIACGAFLFVVIIISAILYTSYFQNVSFSSAKCGTKSISLTGDSMYRNKLVEVLNFIETKDCNYERFVLDNLTTVYATDPGMLYSGKQTGDKTLIAVFSGSTEYVAGIIVHEACHAYSNNSNTVLSEADCAYTQYNFMKSAGASEADLQKVMTSTQTFMQYEFNESNIDAFKVWATSQAK
jgi:hypothetical protein